MYELYQTSHCKLILQVNRTVARLVANHIHRPKICHLLLKMTEMYVIGMSNNMKTPL